jgi:Ca2+-binding RTX toxin-like protein
MIIPGRVKFLKEFFQVSMAVTNLADEPFTFTNGKGTLQLPDGLSLAPTATPQSLSVDMPDIPGAASPDGSHATEIAQWIIRGDKASQPGEYKLQTVYTGKLAPFDQDVAFTAQNADPIKVWGTNALQVIADVDDSAYRTYPYRVRIGLKNVTDSDPANATDVYNPSVELLKEGSLNYIYSPAQQLEFSTDVIHPGDTFYTPYYVLVSGGTGILDLGASFIERTAGAEDNHPSDQVVSHPAIETPATAPKLEGFSDGTLRWDPVAGAEKYQVFRVPAGTGGDPFPTEQFPADPIAETTDTTVNVPSGGGTQYWYAISTVTDGKNEMFHPMVQATTPVGAVARITGSTLDYTAASGEANNVRVSLASGNYTITDSGAGITAGSGCSAVSAGEVTCPAAGVSTVHVDSGDMSDVVVQKAKTPTVMDGGPGDDSLSGDGANETLNGGPGNDTLSGGGGNDALNGGDDNDSLDGSGGSDALNGGNGVDLATYAVRGKPVTVTLDGVANDGITNERDNVQTENLRGGSNNDSLMGNASANVLSGNGGDDSLAGSGGNDSLSGDPGDDTLDGGGGADALSGGTGTDLATYAARDRPVTVTLNGVADDGIANERDNVATDNIAGGSGNDSLTGDAAPNVLTGNRGLDTLIGLGGNDTLKARDGAGDASLDCDGGAPAGSADIAELDASDPTPSGCESVSRG